MYSIHERLTYYFSIRKPTISEGVAACMNIELGFFPKSYIGEIPNVSGFFPFAVDGNAPYIAEFQSADNEFLTFLCNWMTRLDRYPIYTMIEYMDFQLDDIEEELNRHNIKYSKIGKEPFIKIKLTNHEQLEIVIHYLYGSGSMNNFAAWSLSQDLFGLDKRKIKTLWGEIAELEIPVVSLAQDSTVFWIGFDGHYVISISNEVSFSAVESISNSFPPGTIVTTCEFEE